MIPPSEGGAPPRTVRVGLDYLPGATHFPGVGRYVRELVRAFAGTEERPDLTLFEVGRAERVVPPDATGLGAQPFRRSDARLPRRLLPLFGALGFGADRWLGGVDLFHRAFFDRPRVSRARVVWTANDLPRAGTTAEEDLKRAIGNDGLELLAPSDHCASALTTRCGAPPGRVHRVPIGCDHFSRELPEPPPRADPASILVLGRLDAVRSPLAVIEALAHLDAGGLPARLLWVGRRGDASEAFQRAAAAGPLSRRIAWIEDPRDSDLPGLLARASALVHLTDEEATAATPLEAFTFGTPAVVSRIPTLEESLAEDAHYVEGGSPTGSELADTLSRCIASAGDRDAATRRRERAAPHTWARCAEATWAAWKRIAAG